MRIIHKETAAERLAAKADLETKITGELPSPDGRSLSRILSAVPKIQLGSVRTGSGEISFEGRINVAVTASDQNDEIVTYSSAAVFKQTVECPEAEPSMRSDIVPLIRGITVAPSAGGANLDADVDFDIRVISSSPLKACVGTEEADDVEIKTGVINTFRKQPLGSETLRLREEITVEEPVQVISSESFVTVKDVSADANGTNASGVISVSAVTRSPSGRISQLIRQIPFKERLSIGAELDKVGCKCTGSTVYLRSLGDDFPLIAVEAQVSLELYSIEETKAEIPIDLFSPSAGIRAVTERITLYNDRGAESVQTTIKETLTAPDGVSPIKEVLYASAAPIITDIVTEHGSNEIRGLLSTTVVFLNEYGMKDSFKADAEFVVQTPYVMPDALPMADAECIASAVMIDEKNVQVQYLLSVTEEIITQEDIEAVVSVEEYEANTDGSCIMILFASEGEDVFDAAKRFGVPSESVRKLNPDLSEPFKEGDKLLLLM